MANREQIKHFIEHSNFKHKMEQFGSTILKTQFKDHFDSNFPMNLKEDVNKLEELLKDKKYYKLLIDNIYIQIVFYFFRF